MYPGDRTKYTITPANEILVEALMGGQRCRLKSKYSDFTVYVSSGRESGVLGAGYGLSGWSVWTCRDLRFSGLQ